MAKLITEYCLSCLYCRRFSYGTGGNACHYTYDTGDIRRCPPGDGCTYKVIATDEEREAQARKASSEYVVHGRRNGRDRRLDDYIWDERGEF